MKTPDDGCEGQARRVTCKQMKTMTFEVPDDTLESDVRKAVAIRLFENHQVSLGKAAELCGMGVIDFMDELGRLKIPVINLSPEELAHELRDD